MRLRFTSLIALFISITSLGLANTDKYRIILLDDPSSTITIAWNQISGTSPTVYYGTVDHGTNVASYPSSKTVDVTTTYRGMSNQFAKLSGLLPNTNYYFVIQDSNSTSARFWFRTAPNDNTCLSFIAGGDSRNNRTPRQNANLLVSKLKPHGVFFGGDMINFDSDGEWQDWFDDWQLTTASDGRMFPIVPARGNHEAAGTIQQLFNTPTDSYYAITWGNNLIRTYTLNSEISVSGNQLTWLTNDLASNPGATWKMAQYHKPMRPHVSGKSEGNDEYNAWANLFFNNNVRLVVDCDSHTAKTTWPLEPSTAAGNDEGFIRNDDFGTVYAGEGCWGAPLRAADDAKSWTRNSGSFNQFNLIYVTPTKIELRVVLTDNASSVGELSNSVDPCGAFPANLDIWNPSNGNLVEILPVPVCPVAGIACDDSDVTTFNDLSDGTCGCAGIPICGNQIVDIAISSGDDDAEEFVSNGSMYLNSSDLELVEEGVGDFQTVGLRFTNLPVPQGALITNAYIQFTVDEADTRATSLSIRGEDVNNSSVFTMATNNLSSRTTTTASVAWNNIPAWSTIGAAGTDQRTPDLSAIVQEVVNRGGWLAGNSMSFIITGSGERTAESSNGTASPVLHLEYNLGVCLSPKVFLQGAFNGADMDDNLNTLGVLPISEPYTAMGFAPQNTGVSMSSSVAGLSNANKIVDWILIELRDTPTNVVATAAALLQKDGDVVGVDGTSLVNFVGVAPGNYYVVVRHRNHLGVMTNAPVLIN